jgi:aminoglycoside phosphotransferase (APT) family kinase protein
MAPPLLDPALVNREKLEKYLATVLGEDRSLSEPEFPQAGVSNVVAFMKWGNRELVVRRPPPGPIPPGANDVLREYQILRALQGKARVPTVVLSCSDTSVIGAPFFIMDRLFGFVPARERPSWADQTEARRHIAFEFIDALAELHSVDYKAVGLENLGRPEGFVERQVRRRFEALQGIMERCRYLPEMVTLRDWLAKHLPPQNPDFSIVHGDYHVGNVMYASEPPPRLIAMFDWEIATVGDPLTDVGWALTTPGNNLMWNNPGFPTEEELLTRYEEKRGCKVEHLTFHKVLALWRLAIAMEGNYARFVAQNDPRQETTKNTAPDLARRAMALIGS